MQTKSWKDDQRKSKIKQLDSNCISLKNSIVMLSDFVISELDDLKKDFYDFEKNNHQRDDEVFIDLKNLFIKSNEHNQKNYKNLEERIKVLEQKQVQTNDIIYNIEKKNNFEIERIKRDCSDMFDKIIDVLNLNKNQLELLLNGNLKIDSFFKDFNSCDLLLKDNLKLILNNNNEINDKFDLEIGEVKNYMNEIKNQTFIFKDNMQNEMNNLLKYQKEINRKLIDNSDTKIEQQEIDLGFLKKKFNEFEKTVKTNNKYDNNLINNEEIERMKNLMNEFKNSDKNKVHFENELRKMIFNVENTWNIKINDIKDNMFEIQNKLNILNN